MPISHNGIWRLSRKRLILAQLCLLLLGLSLYSYRARELLVCWFFFTVLLVVLALGILAAVLACFAWKSLIDRVSIASPVPPLPAHGGELTQTYQSPPHW